MHDLPGQPRDQIAAQFMGQPGIQPIGNPAALWSAGEILYRRAQAKIDVGAALRRPVQFAVQCQRADGSDAVVVILFT